MSIIHDWALKWRIPPAAIVELQATLVAKSTMPCANTDKPLSEAGVQSRVRLEAAEKGVRLFRNNVGAGQLVNGSFVRWGLCNDSEAINEVLKSSDLIGWRKRTIVPADVGSVIAQTVLREVKEEGWVYDPTNKREIAQMAFLMLGAHDGADVAFVTGTGSL